VGSNASQAVEPKDDLFRNGGNGEFELTVTASTNRTCQLDVSRNLAGWTTLTNFPGTGVEPVKIIDPEAPGQSQRFYWLK